MRRALVLTLIVTLPVLGGCIGDDGEQALDPAGGLLDLPEPQPVQPLPIGGVNDTVVVAVVDSGVNPYHLDWRAGLMPQHQDNDTANDLPLDQGPDAWLPGFPDPSSFASYNALNLTLPEDEEARTGDLIEEDSEVWHGFQGSDPGEVHYHHVPGTKVIGLVSFGDEAPVSTSSSHGARSASVAAGNLFGTCPQCVLVFVNHGDGEAPLEWVLGQPWIDVVTNSYGFSAVMRDRVYNGGNADLTRNASERGQTIFFSAGNGQANTFTVPNPTLFSSQEGPDWMVTVGAVAPDDGSSYTGHGKPADIAAPGQSYPAQGDPTVSSETTFSGTSSATPIIAGTYARGLLHARSALDNATRLQADGVIARGDPLACGSERPDCELADGELTAPELRERLFHGAVHTATGLRPSFAPVSTPAVDEAEFASEGHGTYFAKLFGDGWWQTEFRRLADPLFGLSPTLDRPAGEHDWMVVDSYCRQQIWGTWSDGYWVEGETDLPEPSPAWPLRTGYMESCDEMEPPPEEVHVPSQAPVTVPATAPE